MLILTKYKDSWYVLLVG